MSDLEKFDVICNLIEFQVDKDSNWNPIKSYQELIFSTTFQEKLLIFWKSYTMNSHNTRQSLKVQQLNNLWDIVSYLHKTVELNFKK